MGLLDHRKTWHFSIAASGDQCFRAFEQAMTHPGFKLLAGKWYLERGEVTADLADAPWSADVATYQGRAGAMGVVTSIIGGKARDEEEAAEGSQIVFALSPHSANGRTECSMWLKLRSTKIGFTQDARFFRGSMHEVEKQLRLLDPTLLVEKV